MQEFPSIWLRRRLEDIWYVVPQNEYWIYYLMKLIPIIRFYRLDISYNWYKYNVYYWEQYVDNPMYEIEDDELIDCLAQLILKIHADNWRTEKEIVWDDWEDRLNTTRPYIKF